jgi:hypothetical protein
MTCAWYDCGTLVATVTTLLRIKETAVVVSVAEILTNDNALVHAIGIAHHRQLQRAHFLADGLVLHISCV